MLLCCSSWIPGWINAHGLTDAQMMILDAVALEAGHIIHDQLHQHHWGQEGEDHGRCGHGCRPFIPGDVLGMIVEIPSDLPLEHGIPEQPYHREHGEGRKPFGFLQPHRTDGSGMLAPTTAWFHRAIDLQKMNWKFRAGLQEHTGVSLKEHWPDHP